MSIRKEIKEWFQAYLFVTFIILPVVSIFVEGLVNIDKVFFIQFLIHSIIGALILGLVILFLLSRGALRGRHC